MNDRNRQQFYKTHRHENGDYEDHWFDEQGRSTREPYEGGYEGDRDRSEQGYGSGQSSPFSTRGQAGEELYGLGGSGFRGGSNPRGYRQSEFRPASQGGYGSPSGYDQGIYGQSSHMSHGGHNCCGQGGHGRDEFRQSSQQRGFGQSQIGYGFGQPHIGQETSYGEGQRRSPYSQQGMQGGAWGSQEPKRFSNCGPKGYKRSDERIKEDVSDCLSDGSIDASEITVNVQNGEVTLTGTVTDRRVKFQAESMVERCPGVKDVVNQLRVISRGSASPDGTLRSNFTTRDDAGDTQTSQKSKPSALAGSRG